MRENGYARAVRQRALLQHLLQPIETYARVQSTNHRATRRLRHGSVALAHIVVRRSKERERQYDYWFSRQYTELEIAHSKLASLESGTDIERVAGVNGRYQRAGAAHDVACGIDDGKVSVMRLARLDAFQRLLATVGMGVDNWGRVDRESSNCAAVINSSSRRSPI